MKGENKSAQSSKETEARTKKIVTKKAKAPVTKKATKKSKEGKIVESQAEKGKEGAIAIEKLVTLGKQEIIHQFALKDGDTGSPEVQVAIATQKIANLVKHLEQNPKDNHSRRGLLKIVAKRRRVLNYLQKKDENRYTSLIKKLALKK